MTTNHATRSILSLLVLAVATLIPQLARADMRYSAEFGEYSELGINYVDSARRQSGEWSESTQYFDFSKNLGSDNFGVGFRTWGRTSAIKSSRSASTNASAGVTSDVAVFGRNIDVLDIYGDASTQMRPAQKNASVRVYLLGNEVWSRSGTDGFSLGNSQDIFSVKYKKSFQLGWVPVEVAAAAQGRVWWGFAGGVDPSWMQARFEAGAGLYAQVSASAGNRYLVGLKVMGSTTLLETTATFLARQAWQFEPQSNGCKATYWQIADGGLKVTTLSGRLKIQGQLFGMTETKTIHDWDGWTWNTDFITAPNKAYVATDALACVTVGN